MTHKDWYAIKQRNQTIINLQNFYFLFFRFVQFIHIGKKSKVEL